MDDVFGTSDDEVKLCYYRAPSGCGFVGVASLLWLLPLIGNVFYAETKETNQRRGGGGGRLTSC